VKLDHEIFLRAIKQILLSHFSEHHKRKETHRFYFAFNDFEQRTIL